MNDLDIRKGVQEELSHPKSIWRPSTLPEFRF
jgi:hypothetical protein